MPDFAKDARERYDNKQTTTVAFIEEVWEGIKYYAARSKKHQHIGEQATRIFLTLYEKNKRSPVSGENIFDELKKAGVTYKNYSSHGLWHWLENGADVIKKDKDNSGKTCYSVPNDDFYAALRKVVLK